MMKREISLYKRICRSRKDRVNRRSGFTLVEVMTVLVIISVLAAVTVPSMTGFIEHARKTAYISEASLARTALQIYLLELHTGGTLEKTNVARIFMMTEIGDEENPLTSLMRGSYTKGASIGSLTYVKTTGQLQNMVYRVNRYEIEIREDSTIEVRDYDPMH